MIQVVNAAGAFYNWKTKLFNSGYIPENNLRVTLQGTRYNNSIAFPAATTTTYNIILIAPPDSDTVFDGISGGGANVVNRSISQVSNADVIFAVITSNDENYGEAGALGTKEDPPATSVTSTGNSTASGSTTVNGQYALYNRSHDSYGYGLRLIRQPVDKDWYFETTEAVLANPAGDGVSNKLVTVAAVTDLTAGMELIYHKGTTAPSSTTFIQAIDADLKTLTFSTNQAFENGETMTFRAHGADVISKAIDLDFKPGEIEAAAADHSITVRTGVTSATIPVTDTYGISGGSFVTLSGEGINTSGTNDINTVTADAGGGDTNGEIVMDLSSTVTAGTTLYVATNEELGAVGSTTRIDIEFTNTINRYPTGNRTIYLNLDNFITPGVSGA